jgi:hypothetical protein
MHGRLKRAGNGEAATLELKTVKLENNGMQRKKGRQLISGGPSLGRKRPRRAAGTRGNRVTALHQYAPASHKKQGVLTYFLTGRVPGCGTCRDRG